MKKVLLLFVALFIVTAANAQLSPITFGPKVGYQTTKLSVNRDVIKSDFNGNMAVGLFTRLTIKDFVFQPELLYFKSDKVFQVNFDNFGIQNPNLNPTLSIVQSNFALPIMFGWQFVDMPLLKMRANVGPVFYFAIGEIEYSVNGERIPYTDDDLTEETTFGTAINLGVDLWKFTLDVNYSFGMTETFDDELEIPGLGEFEMGDNTKQNIFTVTLGFKIL